MTLTARGRTWARIAFSLTFAAALVVGPAIALPWLQRLPITPATLSFALATAATLVALEAGARQMRYRLKVSAYRRDLAAYRATYAR